MSYCRFSTDDFQCDLYCYADVNGGYTTHVAANRVMFNKPLPKPITLGPHPNKAQVKEWLNRNQFVSNLLDDDDAVTRVPITLPFAGDTFNDTTLEDFLDTLIKLKEVGYVFPQYVIETVESEIKDRG